MEVKSSPISKLNVDAQGWSSLLNISSLDCHEPLCIRKYSNEELEVLLAVPVLPPPFPLHLQSDERAVKLTSEAAVSPIAGRKGTAS
jgi:hypothetical protein